MYQYLDLHRLHAIAGETNLSEVFSSIIFVTDLCALSLKLFASACDVS